MVFLLPIPVIKNRIFFPKSAFRHSTLDRSFRPLEYFQTTFAPRATPQAETSRPFRPFTTTDFRHFPFKTEENRVLLLVSSFLSLVESSGLRQSSLASCLLCLGSSRIAAQPRGTYCQAYNILYTPKSFGPNVCSSFLNHSAYMG